MSSMSSDELSKAIWDRFITIFQAEMHSGGKLATVKDVRRGIQLWRDSPAFVPAIGVQHTGYREREYATRQHEVDIEFKIVAGTFSSATIVGGVETTVANLDAANLALDPVLSDGSGKGIGPMLRASSNINFGGLVAISWISDLVRLWEIRAGADATNRVWAYGLYTWIGRTYVDLYSD